MTYLTEDFKRLESKVDKLLEIWDVNKKPAKPKKEITFHKFQPIVLKIIADGKIWASHAVNQELIKQGYKVKAYSAGNALNELAKKGKITKIAQSVYQIKEVEA